MPRTIIPGPARLPNADGSSVAYESFGTNKNESLNSGQLIDQFNLRSISSQQSVPDITTSESVARFRDLHQVISQRGDLQEAKKKKIIIIIIVRYLISSIARKIGLKL